MNITWSASIDIAGYDYLHETSIFYYGAEINESCGLFSMIDISKGPPFSLLSSWNYVPDLFPIILFII